MKRIDYNYSAQHAKGKLHAYERIIELVDKDSFHEIGKDITNLGYTSLIENGIIPYDGVITGYGYVCGKMVCIYSQDFSIMGGTVGLMHAEKIVNLYEIAIKSKCPIIGLIDSAGARIQEGVDALSGYAKIFRQNVKASGIIPQISVVLGPCAGGATYSPALTDFIFFVKNISKMFLTGPSVVKRTIGENISLEELGGSGIHTEKSGVVHFLTEDEKTCFKQLRKLLNYLPSNSYENPISNLKNNYIEKTRTNIASIIPAESRCTYDVIDIINEIIDAKTFIEVHKNFAKNIVVGFGKIVGATIGIVANNPIYLAGALNCDASDKAARFVRFCDSFNIPIVTLVDVPGFYPGKDEETKGVIRHGAKLIYAYVEANVPKITVVLRKAYGGAYIAMCCRALGSDISYAWKSAEIAVMGPENAVGILYKDKIKSMKGQEKQAFINEAIREYKYDLTNINNVSQRGYIDEVISPKGTRKCIYSGLSLLKNKNDEHRKEKKHGNIPL